MGESTNFVLLYSGDFTAINNQLRNFDRVNKEIAKNFGQSFANNIKIVSQSLDSIKNRPFIDPDTKKESLKTVVQFSTVFKDAEGNVRTFTEQAIATDKGLIPLNNTMRDGGKASQSFGEAVFTLARRALLTIPIWIALRSSITSVFTTIRDGLKNIIAFDLALQKIRNNLQGTPSEVAASFNEIKKSITETARATGISTEELAGAVKEFTTLGFEANEALQGALGATRLSIALFGDAKQTAGAFAKALNILIDRSKGARNAVDQMNDAFALASQLEETNAFELKDATEALDKFSGTAAGVGLSLNQTLQVLAALGTAGRQGSEGATLLSTSFNTLLTNLPKIGRNLGIIVRAGDSTFDTFTRILDKITELNKTPGGQATAVSAIADIFGGARGIKIVQSLVAVDQTLRQNISTIPDFTKLLEKSNRAINTVSGQSRILANNTKELGKDFVNAIIGTDDFTDSLKELNVFVTNLSPRLRVVGNVLGAILAPIGAVLQTLAGLLSLDFTTFTNGIKNLGREVNNNFNPFNIAITSASREVKEFENQVIDSTSKITKGLRGGLGLIDLQQLVLDLKKGKLLIPKELNGARIIETLEKQLQDQFEGKSIKLAPQIEIEPLLGFKDIQDISKIVLQSQLDILKTQGASNLQLAQAENSWSKQLGIVREADIILKNQLDILKAQSEERRLQNKLGSDSVKLFDIAQSEGVGVAKRIGDVLAGNLDFATFVRQGGQALEVFKKQFEDIFKQQQAQAFFRGDTVPGTGNLRGGAGIAIQEEQIRRRIPSFTPQLAIAQAQAIQAVPEINAQIRADTRVAIELTGKFNVRDEVKSAIIEQVSNPQSDFNKQLNQKLFGGSNIEP